MTFQQSASKSHRKPFRVLRQFLSIAKTKAFQKFLPNPFHKSQFVEANSSHKSKYLFTRALDDRDRNAPSNGYKTPPIVTLCFLFHFLQLFLLVSLIPLSLSLSLRIFWPLLRGEELYTQMGFFVQSILAARYIHRRELRLVSLESLSVQRRIWN